MIERSLGRQREGESEGGRGRWNNNWHRVRQVDMVLGSHGRVRRGDVRATMVGRLLGLALAASAAASFPALATALSSTTTAGSLDLLVTAARLHCSGLAAFFYLARCLRHA